MCGHRHFYLGVCALPPTHRLIARRRVGVIGRLLGQVEGRITNVIPGGVDNTVKLV